MEGWVYTGSLIAARPGIEPMTAWSQVWHSKPSRHRAAHRSINIVQHTTQSFHVGNGHAENRQFVRLACQRTARRYHVTQLVHIRRHLVASPTFYLTMTFPDSQQPLLTSISTSSRKKQQWIALMLSKLNYICIFSTFLHCISKRAHLIYTHNLAKLKLAPSGTDGRLLLWAKFFQAQSLLTQKLRETSKIRPKQM